MKDLYQREREYCGAAFCLPQSGSGNFSRDFTIFAKSCCGALRSNT
jgi:hypothetical protein